jgi:hypothetical protein
MEVILGCWFVAKCYGPAGAGLGGFGATSQFSWLGGVTMPDFGIGNRQWWCGFGGLWRVVGVDIWVLLDIERLNLCGAEGDGLG